MQEDFDYFISSLRFSFRHVPPMADRMFDTFGAWLTATRDE